jgi:hypothetical protein
MPHTIDRNENESAGPAYSVAHCARRLAQLFMLVATASNAVADSPPGSPGPQLRFDPASFDFGTVDPESSSQSRMAALFNDSDSVAATGLHFEGGSSFPRASPTQSCNAYCCEGALLAPGASCTVSLKFVPAAPGPVAESLTITSAEAATAELQLSGVGGDNQVLYRQPHDWQTMPWFVGWVATRYSITTAYSSDMADDFVIDDPSGWSIHKVAFEALTWDLYPPTEPTEVFFRRDDHGLPSEEVLCSTSVPTIVRFDAPYGENIAEVALSPPCHLPPGHYWLQPRFNADSESSHKVAWGVQYVYGANVPVPNVRYQSPVWRRPDGGGLIRDCREWTALAPTGCGGGPEQPVYGTVFWLMGGIGKLPEISVFGDGFDD